MSWCVWSMLAQSLTPSHCLITAASLLMMPVWLALLEEGKSLWLFHSCFSLRSNWLKPPLCFLAVSDCNLSISRNLSRLAASSLDHGILQTPSHHSGALTHHSAVQFRWQSHLPNDVSWKESFVVGSLVSCPHPAVFPPSFPRCEVVRAHILTRQLLQAFVWHSSLQEKPTTTVG